jgi:4-amino-4-deoxy-L-arabinose transferase-like glycosyltransferase
LERGNGQARTRLAAACLAAAALHLGVGVFDHEIWSPTEPAVAGVVWNMVDRGLVAAPHIGEHPYLEKPPGLYWLAWLGVEASGDLHPGWLRLPSALLLLGAGGVLAWVVRRRHGDDAAAVALLLFSTTVPVLELAHRASPDGPALAFATVAFALYLDSLGAGDEGDGSLARDAWLAGVLALSFYAKNLFVAFVVLPPVALDLLLRRRGRRAARLAVLGALLGVVLVGPWLLALERAGGWEFVRVVFVDNTFGRLVDVAPAARPAAGPLNDAWTAERDGPLWIYALHLPAVMAPWTLLWLAALPLLWRERDRVQAFLLRSLWVVPLVLTFSSSRNSAYLRPLAALGVLCAVEFLARGLPDRAARRLAAFNLALVAVVVVALPFAGVPLLDGGAALVGWGALGVGAAILAARRLRGAPLALRSLAVAGTAGVLSLTGTLGLAVPAIDARRSTAAFFGSVAPQLEGRSVVTTVLDDRRYPLLTWYLRSAVPVVESREAALARLASPEPTAVFVSAGGYARARARWERVPHRLIEPASGKRVFVLLLNEPPG